jgi:spore germination protein YaaH
MLKLIKKLKLFMENNKKTFLIFFALFFIFLFPQKSFGTDFSLEKIFYMSNLKEKAGIISLKNNADKIDILAPQFYGISEKLKLVGGIDDQLSQVIKKENIKVMPLVSNAGFKQSVIHNLLISPAAQNLAIRSLVVTAKTNKYIGWQFDFENISYLDKDLYSSFVEKTAESLHKNNLILSVAAVTRTSDYEDTNAFRNWGGVFDYASLARAVDFISLMTYDDPNSVGPVASLPFVNGVLNYVKNKIPPQKLSLGIPLYNWGWSANPSKKISSSGTYSGLLYLRSNFPYVLGFDSNLGASWMNYDYNNKQYKVWYQGSQDFQSKLDLIKQNNLRGFSSWVLGVEDPQIWSTLSSDK